MNRPDPLILSIDQHFAGAVFWRTGQGTTQVCLNAPLCFRSPSIYIAQAIQFVPGSASCVRECVMSGPATKSGQNGRQRARQLSTRQKGASRSPGSSRVSQPSSVRRFLRAMLFSAIASFSVASMALVPQWRAYLVLPDWVPAAEIERYWSVAHRSVTESVPEGWRDVDPSRLLAFLKDDAGQRRDAGSGPVDSSALARTGTQTTSGTSASSSRAQQGQDQDQDRLLFATRFAQCPEFFPSGHMPAVASSYAGLAQTDRVRGPDLSAFRELCFSAFAILHNGNTRTPVFVAQRLNRGMLQQAQSVQRRDRFYEEARLPARERARLDDYRGSGYSRGHMAPAGDMHSEQGMAQSFSLANMVPQNQRQNAGPWNQIEQATRRYIMRARGDVYVFTGPVYLHGISHTIGQGSVAVPDYLYKVVYDPNTQRSWVHWQPNAESARAGPPISYAEFVQRTGLHLLPDHQLAPAERQSAR